MVTSGSGSFTIKGFRQIFANLEYMNALSPLDDRYAARIADVSSLFSGFSFMKYRLLIECEYLIFVVSLLDPDNPGFDARAVRRVHVDFDEAELRKIHERELTTNHDVRALVDYVRSAVPESLRRWVHFGLTSQDINSPAMVMTYRDFNDTILGVELDRLTRLLTHLAVEHQDTVMLTFTHGQPARALHLRQADRSVYREAELCLERPI